MKRWWLAIGLLLSLGFNVGLLTATWMRSLQPAAAGEVSSSTAEVDGRQPLREERTARVTDVAPAPADRPGRLSDRRPLSDVAPLEGAPLGGAPREGDDRMTEPQRLAHRLGLEGERRQRFVALQLRLRRSLRERLPQLNRLRRQLYREMVAPVPDGERLRRLTERMARLNVEIERELVRTVVASRELMDPQQEEMYKRYLAARMGPLQESLAPGPARPRDRQPNRRDGRPP